MANVVVTSTSLVVSADFGDYASGVGMTKGSWQRSSITSVVLNNSSDWIEVRTKDNSRWQICYSAYANSLIIDSVNGVAPSSNSDLYDKIVALML